MLFVVSVCLTWFGCPETCLPVSHHRLTVQLASYQYPGSAVFNALQIFESVFGRRTAPAPAFTIPFLLLIAALVIDFIGMATFFVPGRFKYQDGAICYN